MLVVERRKGLTFWRAPAAPVFIVVKKPRRRVKVRTWSPIEVFWVNIGGEVMASVVLKPFGSAAPKCPDPVRVVIAASPGTVLEGDAAVLPGIGTVIIKRKRR